MRREHWLHYKSMWFDSNSLPSLGFGVIFTTHFRTMTAHFPVGVHVGANKVIFLSGKINFHILETTTLIRFKHEMIMSEYNFNFFARLLSRIPG